MTKQKATRCGLELQVTKDWYDGLWNVCYVDSGHKYAGPYKTKREATERMYEFADRSEA
jgi:hypothetical protein